MGLLAKSDFVRILGSFADDPDEVMEERGIVCCRINGRDISLELSQDEDGNLYCKEEGASQKLVAKRWVEVNLAHLDDLAAKILNAIEDEDCFVPVPSIKETADCETSSCDATTEALLEDLRETPFATKTIYLLAEAGEGKTIIMNRLARRTAELYLEGKIHFVFLPIELGGRPFMRFDDLLIGHLAEKFRFRGYYFKGVVELVKLGLLVVGLDGFEEMTVEGKDDKVISSLGELLSLFDSSGKVVISARKAFYEFALQNQAPLQDVMRSCEIEISAYRLQQWTSVQFKQLLDKRGFNADETASILLLLRSRLGESHPIMTRPVLARKLVDLLADTAEDAYKSEINEFDKERNPSCVLSKFVDVLLTREATQKWLSVSGSGGANKQLLKKEQHYLLLQALAEEMWVSRVEVIKREALKEWTGFICETLHVHVSDAAKCKEKILYHAMLKADGDNYTFCHEAFRMYFLGRQIASELADGLFTASLVSTLDVDVLNDAVIDEIAYELLERKCDFARIYDGLLKLRGGVSKNTPLCQNIGAILVAFRVKAGIKVPCELKDLYINANVLSGVSLCNIRFVDCLIERMILSMDSSLSCVEFRGCVFESIEIQLGGMKISDVVFDDVSLPAHLAYDGDQIYAPGKIYNVLSGCGFTLPKASVGGAPNDKVECVDDRLVVLQKIIKLFSRKSFVSDAILRMKFSGAGNLVMKDCLPRFVKDGVLRESSGVGRGYKLNVNMTNICIALRNGNGTYEAFVSALKQLK